jgi:hypothetical protein
MENVLDVLEKCSLAISTVFSKCPPPPSTPNSDHLLNPTNPSKSSKELTALRAHFEGLKAGIDAGFWKMGGQSDFPTTSLIYYLLETPAHT